MGLLDTVRPSRRMLVSVDARESEREKVESARVDLALKRRQYYEGTQYAKENADALAALVQAQQTGARLPEHRRLHAYSTQVAECIDFLADRLGEGFTVKAQNAAVQAVIDSVVSATPTIAAETDEGDIEIVTDDLLRDAFQTGDVPVYVGWDPIEERPYWEFWESEDIEFVEGDRAGNVEKVVRTVVVWREVDVPGGTEEREVTERTEWYMALNEALVMECRRDLYWDQDEAPRETEWLGLGTLPWMLLRADSRRLRQFRGEALITVQAMETADRYNAVEQIAFLIARYNSHGNVAVIGDGASLKVESDGRMNKDVADVLTFPGGTSIQTIELPTDPQMIEHQKGVLSDALFSVFGLTRVDQDTIAGLGGVSGYALEILNQKSEVTFKRIRRRWRKDLTALMGLTLDVQAWKANAPIGVLDGMTREFIEYDGEVEDMLVEEGQIPVQAWWTVDPRLVYPDRKVEIRMGSGYIVDDVMIRDDFTAKLISQKEALRLRGYGDEDIKKIMDEQDEEAPAVPEGGAFGLPAPASPTKTKAGSTVASTTERK